MSKTILMIHGMWGGPWYWENYIRFFEKKGYRCIAPYLRYHDVSSDAEPPGGLENTSLLDYAEDLENEIRKLHEKPVVIGHSMGGLLTQILSARNLVKAAVLVTPASPSGINALAWPVMKSFLEPVFKFRFPGFCHKLSFRSAVHAMLHLMPVEEQKRIYKKCVYESGKAALEIGLWPLDRGRASAVDESMVTCPVLVIGATEDRITPCGVVRKVADKYQHVATYKEFKNHAHWIIGEHGWEVVAEFISGWLQE